MYSFTNLCIPTSRSLTLSRKVYTLELAFDSESLRTICESEAYAKRELGSKIAEILKHRLADLCAATSIKDLVAGNPRILDGTDNQQMVVDLSDSHRIVFCANHPNKPEAETGKLDWLKVSRIKILGIERFDVK
jgi:proteic killer suppression protein